MRLSLGEAFDLTRTKDVKVGPRVYAVPPLTFGRLDALMQAPRSFDLGALAAFKFDKANTPEAVGRALAYFPVEEFAEAAAAAIPGMTAEDWKKHADPYVLLELIAFFAKTQDWAYIGKQLEGKGESKGRASDTTVAQALVLIARHLGATVPQVLEFRAEGFFACVEAIRETRVREEEERREAGMDEALATGEMASVRLPKGTVTDMDRQIWRLEHPGEDLPPEMSPANG